MERTVVDCDGCGKQNILEHAKLFIITGRSMDPSGNGYEDDGDYVHLCIKCCESRLHTMIKEADYDVNKKWLSQIRAGQIRRSR